MSGARSSDLVAVFGVGGLGHMAMQYARVPGATVVAVDLFDAKLQVAKELGADFVVNARQQDPFPSSESWGERIRPSRLRHRLGRSTKPFARFGEEARSC